VYGQQVDNRVLVGLLCLGWVRLGSTGLSLGVIAMCLARQVGSGMTRQDSVASNGVAQRNVAWI
jgi:hypothetical protein